MTNEASVPRQAGYPKRTQAAIAVVLLLALLGVRAMLESPLFGGPDVEDFDRRFDSLREVLPRGVVGYLSDSDSVAEFFLTQYALSPVVVVRRTTEFAPPGSGSTLVVGNFNSPAAIADALARNKLRVKQDFDAGVLLLEPETR